MDMVQKITYYHDWDEWFPEITRHDDYWRFPLETVADRGGDCEDKAILSVAILSALGHRTCFFHLPGHAAIGITDLPDGSGAFATAADGAWFYYVETTTDNWIIGELPDGTTRDDLRIAAIIEPLRSRQQDPALPAAAKGQWRRESSWLAATFAIIAAAAACVAYLLALRR